MLTYLLYGLVSGFSQFVPVSASAHRALFSTLLDFDGGRPLVSLFAHLGALGALLFLLRQRIAHLYRQTRLLTLPPRRRKQPLDVEAVFDLRLILTAAIPTLIGAVLGAVFSDISCELLPTALLLTVTAFLTYLPDHVVGGNRKVRTMTPLESVTLGVLIAVALIPGLSAVALMLAFVQFRKCDRAYLLERIFLLCGIMLCGSVAADIVRFVFSGFAGITLPNLLGCLLVAAAAFGGALGAILTMRYLVVKNGFSSFAFYNFGLGLFLFILYLVV